MDDRIRCGRCKKKKAPEQFSVCLGSHTGRQGYCKVCARAKSLEIRRRHAEMNRAKMERETAKAGENG